MNEERNSKKGKKEEKRAPIRINKEAYELLKKEKELRGTKSISEIIIKLFEGKKEPEKEEMLRALKKVEELISKGQ